MKVQESTNHNKQPITVEQKQQKNNTITVRYKESTTYSKRNRRTRTKEHNNMNGQRD